MDLIVEPVVQEVRVENGRQVVVSKQDVTVVTTSESIAVCADRESIQIVEVAKQGPPGRNADPSEADKHFRHIQSVPASAWIIAHGLNKYPAVSVVDSAGTLVIGDVRYLDLNSVELTFNASFSGEAYLN